MILGGRVQGVKKFLNQCAQEDNYMRFNILILLKVRQKKSDEEMKLKYPGICQ